MMTANTCMGSLKTEEVKSSSTFIWEISDFNSSINSLDTSIKFIDSPKFSVVGERMNDIKWNLRISVCKLDISREVMIYLQASFLGEITECNVFFKCYLWNTNEMDKTEFCSRKFDKNICRFRVNNLSLDRNGDELKNHLLLSNDTLRIACCVITLRCASGINLYTDVIENLENFFLSEKLSDVTIEVDDKYLRAHKIILSSRSKVFLAMFDQNMTESSENIIKITDISYSVMKEVLRFIYCGKVDNLNLLSKDILVAADKYDIFSLKCLCEETLRKNLNTENACEILNFSDLYNCNELKANIIQFIIKNLKAVIDTEGFSLIKESQLCADILSEVALKTFT